jgi:acyl dehydratase
MAITEIPLEQAEAHIGSDLGVSNWYDLSQDAVAAYTDAVSDLHWMHLDVPRATRELGGTIVPGVMTLGLLFHLRDQIVRFTGFSRTWNYGFERVRFTHPVPSGGRVRLRLQLLGAERRTEAILIKTRCTFELEGVAKPALVADHLNLYVIG